MTKCTEPERWASAPGADADEEEVVSYLAHVGVCPFHAAAEQREEARLRGAVALARDLSAPDAYLDSRPESRRQPFGRALSIRVDGVERARLDPASRRGVTLEVEAGALVAIWRPAQDGLGEETYLTSYVLPAAGGPAGTKAVSETLLEGGYRIIFTTRASAGDKTELTVAHAAPGWLRARRADRAPRAPAAAEPARALRRPAVRRLAVTLCALAAAVLLALVLFPRTEAPVPVVLQEQPLRPDATLAPPATETAPPAADAQSREDFVPAAPTPGVTPSPTPASRAPRGGGPVGYPRPPREHLTVAAVRRIYVSAGADAYDRQLREALIEKLRAGGRFTVVAGEQQADAVLRPEQPRSAGVSVQLVTRTGKTLWFTTQATAAGGDEDVGDLAARIVAALNAAADKQRPPVNAPQQ